MGDLPTGTIGATHPERDEGPRYTRRLRLHYRVAVGLLAAVVVSALVDGATELDVYGVSSDHARATGGGYELDVRYPNITRPALATPFAIVVHRAGGFLGPVDIAIDPEWIEMWDYQAIYPEPSGWTGGDDELVLTFDPPDGEVLRIALDARIQPAQQRGRPGFVAVLDADGNHVVEVDFRTVVLP